jgi:hypothetical protein
VEKHNILSNWLVRNPATPHRAQSLQIGRVLRTKPSIAMMAYTFLLMFSCLYVTWAIFLSRSFFHTAWSSALFLGLLLTYQIWILPVSIYTIALSVLDVLVFAFCVALSPAQLLLFHRDTPDVNFKRLDDLSKGDHSKVLAEFVQPSPCAHPSTNHDMYFRQCNCCSRPRIKPADNLANS